MKNLRVAMILAVGLMAGCSTISKVTSPVTGALGSLMMSNKDEQSLGLQLAGEIKAKEKVCTNATVQAYVEKIGKKVLAAVPSDKKPFPYTFTAIESNQVNAFAIPGGQVFVYTGLLKAVANESELAGVLGHEIAHVTEGHSREQMASQYGTDLVMQIALGKNPGALTQMASQVASQGYLSANSRECETEADSVGLTYMQKAGFAPANMSSFFATLKKLSGESGGMVDSFFASHPDSGDRATTINQLIAERKYGKGTVNPTGELAKVQKLLK